MMDLISYCHNHNIDEILQLPDVKERIDIYFEHEPLQREQIKRCATVYNRLVILDFRQEEVIYAGNRFMVYALFPECDISMHILWHIKNQTTIFAVGKSIIDRGNAIDIGALMLYYGGGGHRNAGTCQVEQDRTETVLHELISVLSASNETIESLAKEELDTINQQNLFFTPWNYWLAVIIIGLSCALMLLGILSS
jgi:nanoRNase/pAp phosphatase (c-di-AMP/oligoRNAs hydrolase)